MTGSKEFYSILLHGLWERKHLDEREKHWDGVAFVAEFISVRYHWGKGNWDG